jgi:hypothetical protein
MGPLPSIRQSDRLRSLLQGEYVDPVQPFTDWRPEWVRGPSNFVQELINPISETGLPNVDIAGPVLSGPTGARNAMNIFRKMKVNAQRNEPPLASAAVRFLKAKYPKIYDKILSLGGNFGVMEPTENMSPTLKGGYWDRPNPVAGVINRGSDLPIGDYTETGAHELGHFIRHLRGKLSENVEAGKTGQVKNLKTDELENVSGTYHPSQLSPEELNWIIDPEVKERAIAKQFRKYFDQPAEIGARQAGSTGRRALEKLHEQVAEHYRPYVPGSNPLVEANLKGLVFGRKEYQDALKEMGFSSYEHPDFGNIPVAGLKDLLGIKTKK